MAGALVLTVDASTELAQRELRQLRETLANEARQINSSLAKVDTSIKATETGFGRLGAAAKALGPILAGAFSAQLFIGLARGALDFAESIGVAADQLGVSGRFLQEFRFAADQTSGSVEGAEKALAVFNRRIGEAAGGSRAAQQSFAALGVSLSDGNGALKSSEQLYRDVAAAIAAIPEPQRQAAAAQALFGRAAQDILPLLRQGADGFAELAQRASELGVVIADEKLQKAKEVKDRLAELRDTLRSRLSNALLENADGLLFLADAFGRVAQNAVRGAGAVGTFFQRLRDQVDGTRIAFDQAGGGLRGLLVAGTTNVSVFEAIGAASRISGSLRRAEPRAGVARAPAPPPVTRAGIARAPRGGGAAARGGAARPSDAALRAEALAIDPAGVLGGALGVAGADAQLAGLEARLGRIDAIVTRMPDLSRIVPDAAVERAEGFASTLAGGLTDAILGARSFGDAMVGALKRIAGELIYSGLFSLLRGLVPGGGGNAGATIAGALAGLFGGFRASGGPVSPGRFYITGERGPELFVPRVPGVIIPGGAGAGMQVSLVVNAPGASAETVALIRRELQQAAPQIAAAGAAAALRHQSRPRMPGAR